MAASPIRLQPGEEVVMDVLPSKWWTWPLYLWSLGLWAIWRKRHHFILSNQRVVMTKGVVSKTERTVPLDRVQDAQLVRSVVSGGRVKLSSAGGPLGFETIGPLSRAEALAFADELARLTTARRQQGL